MGCLESKMPPDYSSAAWWLECPPLGKKGAASGSLPMYESDSMYNEKSIRPLASEQAQADLFFIHGTLTSSTAGGNADSRKDAAEGSVKYWYVGAQLSAFCHECRCFAPFFRQSDWGDAADAAAEREREALAGGDILAAFDAFAQWSAERPIFLAAHSQGSLLLCWLLAQRFEGTSAEAVALRARLAGCYAPGIVLPVSQLPAAVPLCARPGHVGALALWCCATADAQWEDTLFGALGAAESDEAFVIVNPCTWEATRDGSKGGKAKGHKHLGALGVLPDGTAALFVEVVASVVANGGLLRLNEATERQAWLLSFFREGGKDYHNSDIQLFWGNIRDNVTAQLEAWRRGERLVA